MHDSKVLEIVLSYPSSLQKEKDIIEKVIKSWNNMHSKNKNIILFPQDWEHNVYASQEKSAQEHINKSIIENADILIGLVGHDIGTPTEKAESGTLEEINLRIEQKKDVIVCFQEKTNKKIDDIDPQKLEKFKKYKISLKGLYIEFDDNNDLGDKLLHNLTLLISHKYESSTLTSSLKVASLRTPKISLSWYLTNKNKTNGEWQFENTEYLDCKKVHNTAEKEIKFLREEEKWINEFDGYQDPEWKEKSTKYRIKIQERIQQIEYNPEQYNIYAINNYVSISMKIANIGNAPAHNIKVQAVLPNWLLGYSQENLKKIAFNSMPSRPKYNPSSPIVNNALFSSLQLPQIKRGYASNIDSQLHKDLFRIQSFNTDIWKYGEFKIGDNSLSFYRQEKLLHTQCFKNDKDDNFYLFALESAPLGIYELDVQIFCEEYEDWEIVQLKINIID